MCLLTLSVIGASCNYALLCKILINESFFIIFFLVAEEEPIQALLNARGTWEFCQMQCLLSCGVTVTLVIQGDSNFLSPSKEIFRLKNTPHLPTKTNKDNQPPPKKKQHYKTTTTTTTTTPKRTSINWSNSKYLAKAVLFSNLSFLKIYLFLPPPPRNPQK